MLRRSIIVSYVNRWLMAVQVVEVAKSRRANQPT